jgi:hypothetical protein
MSEGEREPLVGFGTDEEYNPILSYCLLIFTGCRDADCYAMLCRAVSCCAVLPLLNLTYKHIKPASSPLIKGCDFTTDKTFSRSCAFLPSGFPLDSVRGSPPHLLTRSPHPHPHPPLHAHPQPPHPRQPPSPSHSPADRWATA